MISELTVIIELTVPIIIPSILCGIHFANNIAAGFCKYAATSGCINKAFIAKRILTVFFG
jgi:hypothetical protein